MNPIFQNYGHVKVIKKIIKDAGFKDIPVISIIAFDKEAQLKLNLDKAHVVKIPYIVDTIKELSKDEIISLKDVGEIENLLKSKILKNTSTKKHVANIKEAKKKELNLLKDKICPKCGGNLVLKHGKYGDFYGCSNFPNCRYTLKDKKIHN